MRGYFISEENVKELGLMNNVDFMQKVDKTVIVFTESDFEKENPDFELNEIRFSEFALWFYKNYYQSITEGFGENA